MAEMRKGKISKEQLDPIISKIVETAKPAKIILFGSYAYGQPDRDSDIDLMVIRKTDMPRFKRGIDIRLCFKDTDIPFDLLVYTPEEFEQYSQVPLSLENKARLEGVVLYEQ